MNTNLNLQKLLFMLLMRNSFSHWSKLWFECPNIYSYFRFIIYATLIFFSNDRCFARHVLIRG